MDLNRLLSMLMRMFFQKALSYGMDYLARRGKPDTELTPEDHQQPEAAKAMADKARKGARLAGRFLR